MAPAGEALAKWLITKTCSRRLQQRLRKWYLTRRVVKDRAHREAEMEILKLVVSGGDRVVDIGANVGVYTRELSTLVADTGIVYSFEPVAESFEVLTSMIARAKLANVRAFRLAMGAQSGEEEMVIPQLDGLRGYYWAHMASCGGAQAGRRQVVTVTTLNTLWRAGTIDGVDFIKCDVEGSELEVIQGGIALLEHQHPGWLLEVSRKTSDEVFRCLKDLGYHAYVYDRILVRTETYRDREFSNYFFLHPNSRAWRRLEERTP